MLFNQRVNILSLSKLGNVYLIKAFFVSMVVNNTVYICFVISRNVYVQVADKRFKLYFGRKTSVLSN